MPPLVHELASESEVSSEDGSSNVSEINCYNSRKLFQRLLVAGEPATTNHPGALWGTPEASSWGKKRSSEHAAMLPAPPVNEHA